MGDGPETPHKLLHLIWQPNADIVRIGINRIMLGWWNEYNAEGELGNGSNTPTSVPVLISGLSGVVGISAAARTKVGHNLALKADGTVWAWGYNYWAELGSNGKSNSNVPVQVPGIRGAIGVSAGGAHSVVLFAH